ncbi:MAG TPA: hypothetical protein VN736_10655 [Candidatus Limnocylindrales bacterium]|nr:hypothetical protein [Candidatus Limnocylindrales bacterium]
MGILQRSSVLIAILVAWALAILWGARVTLTYANTPGSAAVPPAYWPSHAPLEQAKGRASLMIFIHPQCPCSRASVGELDRILVSVHDRVQTTVFFYVPPGSSEGWAHTDLWKSAAAIPTVQVLADRGAAAARRFGARTSGQALLYNANGRLIFSGGITAARGHSGDNDGREAIVSLLLGRESGRRTTPVFGCALYGDT